MLWLGNITCVLILDFDQVHGREREETLSQHYKNISLCKKGPIQFRYLTKMFLIPYNFFYADLT